jgi:transposase-like protein
VDTKRSVVVAVSGRRRRWSPEEKRRLVEETLVPGASVAAPLARWRSALSHMEKTHLFDMIDTPGPYSTVEELKASLEAIKARPPSPAEGRGDQDGGAVSA